MVAVIVQDAQVIRLFQVAHDHIEMLAIFFLYQIFGHLIGDVFLNPFLASLVTSVGSLSSP